MRPRHKAAEYHTEGEGLAETYSSFNEAAA